MGSIMRKAAVLVIAEIVVDFAKHMFLTNLNSIDVTVYDDIYKSMFLRLSSLRKLNEIKPL